jgi:hypothetical protein
MTTERESLAAAERIVRYEADGSGHVYAEYGNGEILPTGVVLTALASQSQISVEAYQAELQKQRVRVAFGTPGLLEEAFRA